MTSLAPRRIVSKRSCVVEQAPSPLLLVREQPQAVLDDDHGAVDDDAEIDRAEAQQIGAGPGLDHADDRDQHRQRNDAGRWRSPRGNCRARERARRPPAARLRAGSSRPWRWSLRPAPCGRRACAPSRLPAARRRSPSASGRPAARPRGCSRRSAAWRCRPRLPRRSPWRRRCAAPCLPRLSATSEMRIGMPWREPMTMSLISSMVATCPGVRTRYCSPLRSI